MNIVKIILAIITVYIATTLFVSRPMEFNSDKWLTASKTEKYRMAKDLYKSKFLIGKSVEEVLSLLGEPTNLNENRILYRINDPIGFYDLFSIHYKQNRVTHYGVHD